jgi:hypothetical protein
MCTTPEFFRIDDKPAAGILCAECRDSFLNGEIAYVSKVTGRYIAEGEHYHAECLACYALPRETPSV